MLLFNGLGEKWRAKEFFSGLEQEWGAKDKTHRESWGAGDWDSSWKTWQTRRGVQKGKSTQSGKEDTGADVWAKLTGCGQLGTLSWMWVQIFDSKGEEARESGKNVDFRNRQIWKHALQSMGFKSLFIHLLGIWLCAHYTLYFGPQLP